MKRTTIKTQAQFRAIDAGEVNEDGVMTVAFSSEEPVERYDWDGERYQEVLEHSDSAVNLSRMNNKAPMLLDHDMTQVIGVVERAWVEAKQMMADIRFSRNSLAQEVLQDIRDKIRGKVSIGYHVNRIMKETSANGEMVYRAVNWSPFEVSVVGVGADDTVGFRSHQKSEFETEIIEQETKMSEEKEVQVQETRAAVQVVKEEGPDRVAQERARVAEIMEIGKRYEQPELAQEAIAEGLSASKVKEIILERKYGQPQPVAEKINKVEPLDEKTVRNYSIFKALRSQFDKSVDAGLEREISQEIQRGVGGKDPQGLYVPFNVLGSQAKARTMYDASGYGVETIQTDVLGNEFIDALRNKAKVIMLGARVLSGLKGDVSIPKQSGLTTSYWLATDTTSITSESSPTTTSVSLTPKNLGVFSDMSRQLLIQSSIDVENFVRNEIVSSIGLALDLAALAGTTSITYEPTGILNQASVNSVTMSSAAMTYAKLCDMLTEIDTDNYEGNLAFITNAKVKGKMAQTLSSSTAAGAKYIWDLMSNMVAIGVRAEMTNQLAVGTSNAAILGDFSQVLIGMWGNGIDLLVDPYTQSRNQKLRILGFLTADVALRHPQAFCKTEDIVTT